MKLNRYFYKVAFGALKRIGRSGAEDVSAEGGHARISGGGGEERHVVKKPIFTVSHARVAARARAEARRATARNTRQRQSGMEACEAVWALVASRPEAAEESEYTIRTLSAADEGNYLVVASSDTASAWLIIRKFQALPYPLMTTRRGFSRRPGRLHGHRGSPKRLRSRLRTQNLW